MGVSTPNDLLQILRIRYGYIAAKMYLESNWHHFYFPISPAARPRYPPWLIDLVRGHLSGVPEAWYTQELRDTQELVEISDRDYNAEDRANYIRNFHSEQMRAQREHMLGCRGGLCDYQSQEEALRPPSYHLPRSVPRELGEQEAQQHIPGYFIRRGDGHVALRTRCS